VRRRYGRGLRGGRNGGHPLLSDHEHHGRWEFNRAEANDLIAEYRRTHASPRSITPAPRGSIEIPATMTELPHRTWLEVLR
jgi:hypothetical protein